MTSETPKTQGPSDDVVDGSTGTDTLKAMASPIRMRILGTLRVNGLQTVGDISERLGEATGAVSYHLTQLSLAGLAEKVDHVDGDKRKSWWRACQDATHFDPHDVDRRSEVVDLFRRSAAVSHEMAYERYLDSVPDLPEDWVDCGTSDDHVLRMKIDEMRGMVDDLNAVIEKWRRIASSHRDGDPGVEQVALTLQAYRWIP